MMSNYNFISYSSVDAQEFAFELYDSLLAGPPSIPVWLDNRKIKPGQDWDEQIDEAIRTCDSLIFLMTPDSVEPKSVCKLEWTRALKYKKAIVPILLQPEVEMPFRLGSRQWIDFTGDFDTGLAKLRKHLRWLSSPEGVLQSMKDRLEDAQRDHRRTEGPDQQIRIEKEMTLLKNQIDDQQRIIDDPEGAAIRVEESITRGIQRERQPEKPIGGVARTKFINPPPAIAPTYFQDRHVETNLISDFLKNDAQRLMTIVGRAGIGKTAMVCRLLKSLEGGLLPDNGEEMSIDGIIYLSETGTRKVTVPNLYADLSSLLPDDIAKRLDEVYRDPKNSTESKMQALMEAFPSGKVILLLDNFENLIDSLTYNLTNTEMNEALKAILDLPPHGVKVIITTRVAPLDVAFIHPQRQVRLDLEKGLESPYAENILRGMDADGIVGLKDAPDDLLNEVRERTLGNPQALEALFAILSDRDTEVQNWDYGVTIKEFQSLKDLKDKIKKALTGFELSPCYRDYLERLQSKVSKSYLEIFCPSVFDVVLETKRNKYNPYISSQFLATINGDHYNRQEITNISNSCKESILQQGKQLEYIAIIVEKNRFDLKPEGLNKKVKLSGSGITEYLVNLTSQEVKSRPESWLTKPWAPDAIKKLLESALEQC